MHVRGKEPILFLNFCSILRTFNLHVHLNLYKILKVIINTRIINTIKSLMYILNENYDYIYLITN